MPKPSTSLATLRPDLGASFMEFDLEMQRRGYVATQVLPVIEVMESAGTFGIVALESLLQNRSVNRASGSNYNRGDWKFDDVTFGTKERGFEEPIDDREAKLYRNYFDAEQIATMRAYEAVLQAAEQRVATQIFNATTWTGASLTTAVSTPWSTAATATPITDVEAAIVKIWENTGLWANALIVSRLTFRKLRNCTQIVDRITASGAGSPAKSSDVTAEMLARVFDLDKIIVAGTPKNTAAEGQTASISSIWRKDYAMVAKVATSQDIKEPCLGRTFHWSEDGSEVGGAVETYRDEAVRSDIVRVRHDVDEKTLYTECGHLLTNVSA